MYDFLLERLKLDAQELKQRTRTFAVRIVGLVETLERSKTVDVAGHQLIRSATSVASNYRAVCRSRSKADFVNKLGIVEEEADETLFWLELLVDCQKVKLRDVQPLLDEAEQLTRIFSASRITAKTSLAGR
jgi:four helix bundle protein